jgi:hypothetical protein
MSLVRRADGDETGFCGFQSGPRTSVNGEVTNGVTSPPAEPEPATGGPPDHDTVSGAPPTTICAEPGEGPDNNPSLDPDNVLFTSPGGSPGIVFDGVVVVVVGAVVVVDDGVVVVVDDDIVVVVDGVVVVVVVPEADAANAGNPETTKAATPNVPTTINQRDRTTRPERDKTRRTDTAIHQSSTTTDQKHSDLGKSLRHSNEVTHDPPAV